MDVVLNTAVKRFVDWGYRDRFFGKRAVGY